MRFVAICLLSIHLFYIGGYTLVYQYYIHMADVQMDRQVFSGNIENRKLIEIKIPVSFPTLTEVDGFKFISGEVKLNNAYYNYIKVKYTRDTVYFVCLPNPAKTRLIKANHVTAKEISDVPAGKTSHNPVKKLNLLDDYNLQAFLYNHSTFSISIKNSNSNKPLFIHNPFIESPGKPPNFNC